MATKHVKRFSFRFSHLRFLNFVLAFALVGTFFLHFSLAATAGWSYPEEADFVNRINSRRGGFGLNGLYWSGCMTNAAREHAKAMADNGRIYHSDLGSILTRHCGDYGYAAGENVGGPHISVQDAWDGPVSYMKSPCHQANIDSRTFTYNVSTGSCSITGGYGSMPWTHTAVGVWHRADGYLFSVQMFVYAPDTRYGNFNQAVNANPVPSYSNAAPVPVFGTLGKTVGYTETFVRGTDNQLYHKYYKNGWSGWEALGGQLTSSPAWVSWGQNRVDVFARGNDNALWHRWGTNTGWSGWESLGGSLTSAPTVASWGENRLDVFARGTDNAIWHRAWNGSTWEPWKSLGGIATSAPSAASMSSGLINVFIRGQDKALYNKQWDGRNWSGWQSLGGTLASAPGAVSMGANSLNVFVRGTDQVLYNKQWDGRNWSGWQRLDGQITHSPYAVSWGSGRIDVYARGLDGAEYHKWWDGRNWSGWEGLGGQINPGAEF